MAKKIDQCKLNHKIDIFFIFVFRLRYENNVLCYLKIYNFNVRNILLLNWFDTLSSKLNGYKNVTNSNQIIYSDNVLSLESGITIIKTKWLKKFDQRKLNHKSDILFIFYLG